MKRTFSILFGLVSACLLVSGCLTSAPGANGTCWSCNDQRMVRIDTKDPRASSSGVRPYNHPLTLPQMQWEAILRSVQVQSIHRPLVGASYHGTKEPAFIENEVRYLNDALRRAFEAVTPEQRVVFALERTSEAGLPQLTSGAWFVDQDRVHLQLANVWVTVTMPAIRKLIWKDPLAAQPGMFYELVAGDHQWLEKELNASSNPFREALPELVIDYRTMIDPRPRSAPTPAETAAPAHSPSLEDSLRQLKRLYDQGLITEEDYRTKKQQLLDRL